MRRALVLFTKVPEPGHVKTRLIGPNGLTDNEASAVYSALLQDVFEIVQKVVGSNGGRLYVFYTPADKCAEVRELLSANAANATYRAQQGLNTAERIAGAFDTCFRDGNDIALVVFGDQPGLSKGLLLEAFETLETAFHAGTSKIVVGPTCDGGTYLIGSTSRSTEWLHGSLDCSNTNKAVARLLIRARASKIPWTLLPERTDVDDLVDLSLLYDQRLEGYLRTKKLLSSINVPESTNGQVEMSVVIPTLNEEKNLERSILSIRAQRFQSLEVIVVDGGSTDNTVEIANRLADRVVVVSHGSRQHQENVGAKGAKGDILLFMHADTLIPESFLQSIAKEMSDQSAVAGSARLIYLPSRLRYRALSALREAVWRILRVSGMGSTFFVRRRILHEMGWFDEGMNEEGIDMSKKLHGRGRLILLEETAQTSARRYESLGFFRTMVAWMLTVTLTYIGLRATSIEKHIWRVIR